MQQIKLKHCSFSIKPRKKKFMCNLKFAGKNDLNQVRPICKSTIFRSFVLEKNSLFKSDNKEYVHFFFLLKGEVRICNRKNPISTIRPNEFFFIPNKPFICRATENSRFILFTINKFHYRINKNMYKDIMPVVCELKLYNSPLTAPLLLSVFLETVDDYLKRGLTLPAMQNIKQRELFFLFHTLYAKNVCNELLMPGRLPLS
ncbi:hypothetical protein M2470_002027 [Parabacteroides sp. PH5-46]|nr:hypothetical protein [Parabacteroides sp. PH5-46]